MQQEKALIFRTDNVLWVKFEIYRKAEQQERCSKCAECPAEKRPASCQEVLAAV